MLQLKAIPAKFSPPGTTEYQPLDPGAIVKRTTPATLGQCKDELATFVDELPKDRSFVVFAHWARVAGKPPHGFKAATDRNEFYKPLNRDY